LANASRWSLSARQGFLVCGLFIAGLFVLCCGTGMNNIPVAALGVAAGLLGPVVIVLSSIRANRADVFGTAHVSQSSPPPTTGITGRADLHLVVNAQGIRNVVVRVRDPDVPVSKWPDVGATLPVLIPNGNPRRLQVLWDQVRGHHDAAMGGAAYSPYEGSPYADGDYYDEDAEYADYPADEDESVVIDPVAVDEASDWLLEPEPAENAPVGAHQAPALADPPDAVASTAAGTAAGTSAGAVGGTSPPRRRPSPRPYPGTAGQRADSVEAVVPMASIAPPPPPPADPEQPAVFEATPPAPAGIERTEPTAPEAGAAATGTGNDSRAEHPAAPAAAPGEALASELSDPQPSAPQPSAPQPSEPDAPTIETAPVPPATAEANAPAAPSPAEAGAAVMPEPAEAGATATPAVGATVTPEATEAAPEDPERAPGDRPDAGPAPYLASYFADEPDDAVPSGLSGVHNVSVTLIVADLRRSLTFYRDRLGLTEIDSGIGHAVVASGNARILLRQVTDTRPVDRRVVHLNLEVDDVHEAYERLRREGVDFMHPPRVVNQGEQLEQWAATLRDPDGHAIALTRWEVRP
jgi:catechol 2,3-dioxygenase-like lactoylglutathione lyase family enzyme